MIMTRLALSYNKVESSSFALTPKYFKPNYGISSSSELCIMATAFKAESGMQLLTRLTRKPDLENFYPKLFKSGLKLGHAIEIYSDDDISCIIIDVISESLIPREFGGKESGIIVINTDGKIHLDILLKQVKRKLQTRINDYLLIDHILQKALSNLFIFEVFNVTQLHATLHNLDSLLISQSNVALVIFDTLTAFYWSEQCFKIMKMDVYIKNLLGSIQNVLKDYKVAILYTRPQYFSSSKEHIENLEACCENPTNGYLNFRIQIVYTEETNYAAVRTFNDCYKSPFKLLVDDILWL